MKVLLIGGGAREHALAWKLAQSPRLEKLYAAPGNPGIAAHAELVDLAPGNAAIVAFAREENVGLVVVGPEQPLVQGLADQLRADGILVFGPSAAAARLEGSKGFTKALCAANAIPTAAYALVHDRDEGLRVLADHPLPVVVKADGLAAGKGVTVAETREEAAAAIDAIFAVPGGQAVIEAFLVGEEASFFALTDGTTVIPFGTAQDHKRVGDGDTGPNTGGMGAYSPAPIVTPAIATQVMAEIVEPTVRAMAAAGTPYAGVLYAGLMLTGEGPRLIEYNCRFGDPEAEVLLPRLHDDLLPILLAVAEGRLHELPPPHFTRETALAVVMAAEGYPGTPASGGAVEGVAAAEETGAIVFQAGTALQEGTLVANGGRVLAVTALGDTVTEARDNAYLAVDRLHMPQGFCRRDIGWREVARVA
jgi:phosphoribosylamine--glycine ligase